MHRRQPGGRLWTIPLLGVVAILGPDGSIPDEWWAGASTSPDTGPTAGAEAAADPTTSADPGSRPPIGRERLTHDLNALALRRPGYPFWRHVFTIPDGSVAFGSAEDGRLLAVFPIRGDWAREAVWVEGSLAGSLQGRSLAGSVSERREQVAEVLESRAGPVVHNQTRGEFLRPNVERYGDLLSEWGRIYERFGVPAEVGLAQALVESGLGGRVRSEAGAIGLCQWLEGNWKRLQRLAPSVLEGYNQTTQAPYCAAYLTVLATRYGSFIPALSEHHAGGTNVGRVLIYGEWMGEASARDRYLLGSELVRDLRRLSTAEFGDVVGSYGPRSFLYSEMVFGNMTTVGEVLDGVAQSPIHAMRVARAIPLEEIVRRTGLPREEIQRYNPSLVRQVPRGANLYLPAHVDAFGEDVAFWRRPPPSGFQAVLGEFLALDLPAESWGDPAFEAVFAGFRSRFRATGTEEGDVMAAVLGYLMQETFAGPRAGILARVRTDERVRGLVHRGIAERVEVR